MPSSWDSALGVDGSGSSTGGNSWDDALGLNAPTTDTSGAAPVSATQARLDALLAQKKAGSGGGLFDSLKSIGGDVVGGGLKLLGLGKSTLVSAGNQLGNIGADALGRNQDDPNYRPSLGDFFSDIKRGIGAGDVIQESHPNWSPWVKDAAGGALDIAVDPLNAVAPGADAAAKSALTKAGQVIGDDAARAALREGGTAGLRTAVEEELAANAAKHGGDKTLEDVLARGTQSDLGTKGTEDVVQSHLSSLDNARPGAVLRTPGALPDIGIPGSAKLAGLGHDVLQSAPAQAVSDIFTPTARIEREMGQGAADATSQAVHTASAAKMAARAAGDVEGLEPVAAKAVMDKTGAAAMADNLAKDAPEIAVKGDTKFAAVQAAKQGFIQLPGTNVFVHPLVDQALKDAVSAPAGRAVAAWDKVMSTIKQLTVFNPLNAVQHDFKRGTFNALGEIGQNGLDLAAHKAGSEAYDAMSALSKLGEAPTAENFIKYGADAQTATKWAEGAKHIMADNPMFEADQAGAHGVWGTRTAAHIAEKNGSVARLSVFLKGVDGGLTPAVAAAKARAGLLDFTNVGLTPFERDYAQRLAFFYKFPRRAIPAGITFAAEHPAEANLLSKVGLGAQQGARNQYGEHIGPALDTPLEASFSGLSGLASNPLSYALGEANPAITALLDSKKRGVGDVFAPIGMVQKHVQNAADASGAGDRLAALGGMPSTSDAPGVPGPGGIPLPGMISGEDYKATGAATKEDTAKGKFTAVVTEKSKAGKNLTQKEALSVLADKAGVENPYSTPEAGLLQALQDKGMDPTELLKALKVKVPARSLSSAPTQ